ncbi:TPA: dTDP-glucose 4,6-dehydratase [Candidatus Collierbacteria bacterium]|nr:MAG: dTDP-glucose 4,6-dehydratase [Candidatus Collierbacteria bacterium GW2011_GWB2_42_12]HAI22470.1 dTDP-glucose 4,6-dehydratase [Candidatus Collierbacteria bacterium]HAS68627.1 dTDP-glucose 4,6-dehydratase [Candidatus Collierbacteria bacterium]HBX64164.1 dTDP-glucose 4,6-dehydratase [Candidatus Collierbacteria bacterium]HCW31234.1 dTDP-glucose 4,6-dehydratase [Candidatus Collierbacteria bacterium]
MKILVTGGAGFIGSNFIHYWLENHPEDEIINFDLLTYAGHLESLQSIKDNPHYSFVQGDITDAKAVDEVVSKVEAIIHFAAESHVDRSILDPLIFTKTNIMGTQVLLEAAKKYGIKKFHHVSTDEVFGALPLDSDTKFNETTPYNPHSPYAASKASSDHIVRAYFDTFNVPITITNCSNNFGPYQDPEKFMPRLITNLLIGQKVKIYGDGKYVRDWLHVIDHCRAIDLVFLKAAPGSTYCVGGMTKDVNNLEVAQKVIKLLGKNEADSIEFVTDRPGHDRRYAVDWTKINKDLGWSPQYDFDSWLEKTVNWYKENETWWKPLKEKSESIYKK